jgi:glutamate-5-semialdehyde dehydrogenase
MNSWIEKASRNRKVARELAALSAEVKTRVLLTLRDLLNEEKSGLLRANEHDCEALSQVTSAFRDRLTLTGARIEGMRESLKQVSERSDPIGSVVDERVLPNGLRARRERVPLGSILMIFESRPNVAIESFSLAFFSGNVIWLRGGKESIRTVRFLGELIHRALEKHGVSKSAVVVVDDPDRGLVDLLLKRKDDFDVVVPRGGDRLIEHVTKESLIPLIKNDRGMCHVYVDEDADLEMALAIIENAKKQRPGVCNAMETLLIHEQVAKNFLPTIFKRLSGEGLKNPVLFHACKKSLSMLPESSLVQEATEESYTIEYLDFEMNVRVVNSLDEAIEHISKYGSRHSEAIITKNKKSARHFQKSIDAAAVYWNASTRFTDGFELGLGGELGISTQKLHVRGPVGVEELTCVRWVLDGQGQVRK